MKNVAEVLLNPASRELYNRTPPGRRLLDAVYAAELSRIEHLHGMSEEEVTQTLRPRPRPHTDRHPLRLPGRPPRRQRLPPAPPPWYAAWSRSPPGSLPTCRQGSALRRRRGGMDPRRRHPERDSPPVRPSTALAFPGSSSRWPDARSTGHTEQCRFLCRSRPVESGETTDKWVTREAVWPMTSGRMREYTMAK